MATHQEKLAAKQYVDGVGVMPVLEEMLNDLGRSKPADPVGFCAGFLLSRQAHPTVSRLAIREAINSAGKPAVRVSCIACVRNQDTVLASASVGCLGWRLPVAVQQPSSSWHSSENEAVGAHPPSFPS